MTKLSDIKEELQKGDQTFIARTTGYSKDMVKKVLNGKRNNQVIIDAAAEVVKGRKSLEEQIRIMCEA